MGRAEGQAHVLLSELFAEAQWGTMFGAHTRTQVSDSSADF